MPTVNPTFLSHSSRKAIAPLTEGASYKPFPSANAHDFWQHLVQLAISWRASDIHLEPQEQGFQIRLRVDGILRPIETPHADLRNRLISHIKVAANMDIAEKRLPQDGRITMSSPHAPLDLRVSSLPTLYGEKLVVRLLGNQQRQQLHDLGFEADDLQRLQIALRGSSGMLLATGPTGSGKTQTLYACLDVLNQPSVNISTIEDPCEILMQGINQVNVNERAGLTFAKGLRAFLRQDPDVLMVGEIRDTLTAEIALQAAQTGHLVLSTLHTNDAPSALIRLQHMQIQAYQVAASLQLIMAQRLLRRLCVHCKSVVPAGSVLSDLGLSLSDAARWGIDHLEQTTPLYQPVGCANCHGGYSGRVGAFQLLLVTPALSELMVRSSSVNAIDAHARQEGMRTLRQAGWLHAARGTTSLSEVLLATRE